MSAASALLQRLAGKWQPRSLGGRQLLAGSLGMLAFLALAGWALDRAFAETARNNLSARLESLANAYINGIDFDRAGAVIDYEVVNSPPDPRFLQPGSGLYAQVVLPEGHWVSTSGEGPGLPEGGMLAPAQRVFEGPLPAEQIDGSPTHVYRFGVGNLWGGHASTRDFPYTVYILEDASTLDAQVRVFRAALWLNLGGVGIILLLLKVAVVRWALRPLGSIVKELDDVQRGQIARMSDRHPQELLPLTTSINALIDSERENLEHQRNVLADLAHSLKTPLAVLGAQLDDGVDAKALREELGVQLRRMNDLVSYQLTRAASGGHKLFSAPIVIEPHAEEIVRGLEKVYAAKRIICEFEIDPNARFYGETGDLQELLGNLLENAFKWARSRVLLTIAVGPRVIGNRRSGLMIAVDDDGPGIAEENVANILQRGVRGDERVQGHGIGLSIVQDLVKSYRGNLQVLRSQELGGARFQVNLPPSL